MTQIIYKSMHVYVLHRSDELDHKYGRPAILLRFKIKYSLIWCGTTKLDLKKQEKPFNFNKKSWYYF